MSLQNIGIRWHNIPRLWPTQILLQSIVIRFDLAHNNIKAYFGYVIVRDGIVESPFLLISEERTTTATRISEQYITTDTWFNMGHPSFKINPVPIASLQILGAELTDTEFKTCRVCFFSRCRIWQVPRCLVPRVTNGKAWAVNWKKKSTMKNGRTSLSLSSVTFEV